VLEGIFVLDFSTYLPGPLATLMMADAGAEVVKVERPESGDPARVDEAIFTLLNRGKRSIALDLKRDAKKLIPLIERADILIEQFRPGVMDRLGLGYDDVVKINPDIIYASISGYGSQGPDRLKPGHDLNYVAETGLLYLNADKHGDPVLPAALAADLGGGTQAAFSSIALALFRRQQTGQGTRLDIAMIEGTLPFLNEAIAHELIDGSTVTPGYSAATGSSPRYNIYRTADGRHLACAATEEKFWATFCAATGVAVDADHKVVADQIAKRSAADWLSSFAKLDIPCSLVQSVAEALANPSLQHFFDRSVEINGRQVPALPGTINRVFRNTKRLASAPDLGEANRDYIQ
jgi:crotonobetainyl-CoA:carnitine CoA-transferase CaiB-like acyl-CoA transferase